jgi:hypothetical protein
LSVSDNQVLRQCLSFLPLKNFVAPILDYRKQKLTTANVLKIFIAAQLLDWKSLEYIEQHIRSDEQFQQEFGLASISKSQLSRRINDMPVDVSLALFQAVVHKVQSHTRLSKSNILSIDKSLAVVDSTNIRLPFNLAKWARVTKHRSGVKVHTRLMVVDKDTQYPDKIVPSTGNVTDFEGSDLLVVDPHVLYVMDRGYVCYKRMQRWTEDQIDFVIRVNTHHHAEILEEHELPESESSILRDATVQMGNNLKTTMRNKLRLIEFVDDTGRFYRLATTRWDLPAKEITEIYRQRWLIELFFKWMKQHLRFAQLYSHQPQAVWNHIFLALVAYGLSLLMKLETQSKKTVYKILTLIRTYAEKKWSCLEKELYREPTKASKGRQKKSGKPIALKAVPLEGVQVKKSKSKMVIIE